MTTKESVIVGFMVAFLYLPLIFVLVFCFRALFGLRGSPSPTNEERK